MKFAKIAVMFSGMAALPLAAQVVDHTGNNKLNGTYYFREVIFTQAGEEVAMYGNIGFSGNGTYTISGAQAIYCNQCYYGPQPIQYAQSGNYTISASGFGSIVSPVSGDTVYGSVGANGVFVGSSTESTNNDLFIAAPVSGQAAGTFQGSYSIAYVYPAAQVPYDALLQMTPNGSGGIGTVNITAYAGNTTPALTQSIPNVKYLVSNNAFKMTFPSSSTNLLTGDYYVYSTPDGSFVFGGSPYDFDMFVGVKGGSSGTGFGGWYYQAGMDLDNSQLSATGSSGMSDYYGSLNASNGAIVGHQRIENGSGTAQSYTYSDTYPAGTSGTYNTSSTQFYSGSGGAVRIGLGLGPYPGISVAVQAPNFSGSGVYLSPIGVVNAASYAPFTAGVSRGELVTLLGSNIGPATLQVAQSLPLPQTLGGVQVLVNGTPAPIYYVSSTQVSAIVPWETTASVAQFQVVYNNVTSNAVTELVNLTTPGVFTIPPGGIGYAAATHQDYSLVTPSNPAQPGETISVYLTGLGDVFPAIQDGAAGPSSNLSQTHNTIAAYIQGTQATVGYAGLAPGLVALYQVNVTIPSTATAGDTYLDISGPDSYTSESAISIAGSASATAQSQTQRRPKFMAPARPLIHPGGANVNPRATLSPLNQ